MEAVSSISNNNCNKGIICQPLRPGHPPARANKHIASHTVAFGTQTSQKAQNFGNQNIKYQNPVSKKNELGIA